MKKIIFATAALAVALSASAGEHYVPGVEGIQGASVPPPGTNYLGNLFRFTFVKAF